MNFMAKRGSGHTAESNRLPEIEVLRAIAITMVLIKHMPFNLLFWPSRYTGLIFHSGLWTGVDLFFAVSGFVIARALLPRLDGVTDMTSFIRIAVAFWIQRAWRLLPSSWLWLLAPLPLCLFFNHSHAYYTLAANWEMCVAGLLDMANFHTAAIYGLQPTGAAFPQWSLSLEEQFYFVLPWAVLGFGRYLVIPLGLLAVAGFFVPNNALTMQLRVWPVAFGVLLAIWSASASYRDLAPTVLAKAWMARNARVGMTLACLFTVGCTSLVVVPFFQGPIAVISVFLVWLASYGQGYLWPAGRSRRILEFIAARSYSLYLVHIPVYFGAHEVWYRLHKLTVPDHVQAVVLLVATFVTVGLVAEANHRLLEAPLREHGKKLAAAFRNRTLEAEKEPAFL
jgi:peptidoglycan/LPS O-acetylase OafA/YrhL